MYNLLIIKETLIRLKNSDYREGFNDSVASHIRQALYEGQSVDAGNKFWSDFCNVSKRHPKDSLIDLVGQDVYDLYLEVEESSNGPGAFKMPSWGTYGT